MTVHETLATGVVMERRKWLDATYRQGRVLEFRRASMLKFQRQGLTLREISKLTEEPYEEVRKILYDDVVRS